MSRCAPAPTPRARAPALSRPLLTAEQQDAAVGMPGIGGLDDLHLRGQPLPEAMEPRGPGGHQLARGLQAPEPGACGGKGAGVGA